MAEFLSLCLSHLGQPLLGLFGTLWCVVSRQSQLQSQFQFSALGDIAFPGAVPCPRTGCKTQPQQSWEHSRISSLDVQPLCLLWSLFCSFEMFRDISTLQQEMFALLICHQFSALLLSPSLLSHFLLLPR